MILGHFESQYFKSRRLKAPQPLLIHSYGNDTRVSWLNTQIFMSEHSHFSPEEIDRMEIVDFMLLLKECEKIYEAKKKAMD